MVHWCHKVQGAAQRQAGRDAHCEKQPFSIRVSAIEFDATRQARTSFLKRKRPPSHRLLDDLTVCPGAR
eukprot:1057755-Pyramimonas_sp.AAC.1